MSKDNLLTLPMLPKRLEDPLEHLPCSVTVEYTKGEVIYDYDHPATRLYLILHGKVNVARRGAGGESVGIEIYKMDEFFGEGAFLELPRGAEQATALEPTKVMVWDAKEMDGMVMRRPRLALALLQVLTEKTKRLAERIESLSSDSIERRLGRVLLDFSERMGVENRGGMVGMLPITHEVLSQHVGTSREIVTHYMNRFKRDGIVQYDRKRIAVDQGKMKGWLEGGRKR